MKQNATTTVRLIALFLFVYFFNANVSAQHSTSEVPTAINDYGLAPHASAILDVQSINKGMLVPRMTTAQRSAISSPAAGLLVFDTSTGGFWFYNGSTWADLGGADADWTQATGGIYNNTGKVSVNTTTIDVNSNLYVPRISTDYGADKASIYGYRSGSSTPENGGTSWGNSGVDAAVKGYSFYGNNYTAGVAGYNYLDYTECAGVIGANSGASIFGALAYKDAAQTWAGYFNGDVHVEGGRFMSMNNSSGETGVLIKSQETSTSGAEIALFNFAGTRTIELDAEYGGKGRIITQELQITGGSDFAENFSVSEKKEIQKGMVLSIDEENSGKLKLSTKKYDKKVTGIVSGANGVDTGLIMSDKGTIADGEFPVALSGRAYVMTNKEGGKIQIGDFLTTSSKQGVAMRVENKRKAQGAIIGKAITEADENGFVLILITLQ